MVFRRLLVALILVTPAIAAQQDSADPAVARMGLSGYLAELENWRAAAARLKQHPEEAPALRQTLPRAWLVSFEGQHVEVSNRWLDALLKSVERNQGKAEATGQRIEARLEAMRAEAALLARPSGIDPNVARSRLAAILERREFRGIGHPTWLNRLWRDVERWLTKIMEALRSRLPVQPGIPRSFLWVVVIGLVLASLVWLARFLLSRPSASLLELQQAAPALQTWQQLIREAQAAAARNDYRAAIRLAYWAGIHRLEQAGLWQMERARTHREYLRLLSKTHPKHAALVALTAQFEHIWYGGQAATADQFRLVLVRLEELGCLFPSIPATASS